MAANAEVFYILAIVIIIIVCIYGYQQGWFTPSTPPPPPSGSTTGATGSGSSTTGATGTGTGTGSGSTVPVPSTTVPAVVVSDAVVDVYADNFVDVQLNGVSVQKYTDDWWNRRTLTIPKVKAGDSINFVITNAGGPGGLFGAISWNGKTVYTSPSLFTSSDGTLGVPPQDWQDQWNWSVSPSTFASSQWIWTTDLIQNGVRTISWKASV